MDVTKWTNLAFTTAASVVPGIPCPSQHIFVVLGPTQMRSNRAKTKIQGLGTGRFVVAYGGSDQIADIKMKFKLMARR